MFGRRYSHTLWSESCSSCLCRCFSLEFARRATVARVGSNQEVAKEITDGRAAECSGAVCLDVAWSVWDAEIARAKG